MKKQIPAITIAALVLLWPKVARADGISIEFIMLLGLVAFVPIMFFIVPVETFIISRYLKTTFRETLGFVFWTNIISSLVGVFVNPFNQMLFETSIPKEFYLYFKYYLPLSIVIYLIYFAITVLVEFLWGLRWVNKTKLFVSTKSLALSILLANAASYSVLSPLHYWASYPKTNIKTYATNTQWARQPAVKIFYINNETKYLMQINSDGTGQNILVSFPVEDYMFSSDLNTFVLTGVEKKLYWYRKNSGKKVRVADISPNSMMSLDLSPSGEKVVYRDGNDLVLFDALKEREIKKYKIFDPCCSNVVLAWSNDELIIYLQETIHVQEETTSYPREERKIKRLSFTSDWKVSTQEVKKVGNLCDNYGRYALSREGMTFLFKLQGVTRGYDEYEDIKVRVSSFRGPNPYLAITSRTDKKIVTFAIQPGLLRGYLGGSEPSFIQKGKECLFEVEWSEIYLIDIENKILGKVTNGHDHVVTTDSYTKKTFFENLWRYDIY